MSKWWQCVFIFQTRTSKWWKAQLSTQSMATERLVLTLDSVNIWAHTHKCTQIETLQGSPVLLPACQLETTHPDHTESENSLAHSHAIRPTGAVTLTTSVSLSAVDLFVTWHIKQRVSAQRARTYKCLNISSLFYKLASNPDSRIY